MSTHNVLGHAHALRRTSIALDRAQLLVRVLVIIAGVQGWGCLGGLGLWLDLLLVVVVGSDVGGVSSRHVVALPWVDGLGRGRGSRGLGAAAGAACCGAVGRWQDRLEQLGPADVATTLWCRSG
jgi:hypothetical protein